MKLEVECPACEHKFTVPVEVRVAAPEPKPRRRWLRALLALAGLAAVGGCTWWAMVR